VIIAFDCKETRKIWNGQVSRKFPREARQVARRKLVHVNSAPDIKDLSVPPGSRLERLKGGYGQYHSIRINQQWRIVFVWKDGNTHEVKITDYH